MIIHTFTKTLVKKFLDNDLVPRFVITFDIIIEKGYTVQVPDDQLNRARVSYHTMGSPQEKKNMCYIYIICIFTLNK